MHFLQEKPISLFMAQLANSNESRALIPKEKAWWPTYSSHKSQFRAVMIFINWPAAVNHNPSRIRCKPRKDAIGPIY